MDLAGLQILGTRTPGYCQICDFATKMRMLVDFVKKVIIMGFRVRTPAKNSIAGISKNLQARDLGKHVCIKSGMALADVQLAATMHISEAGYT